MFEIITVVVVLIIFGAFAYGAYRAEKVVNAKAKEQREDQAAKTAAKGSGTTKAKKISK